MRLLQADHPGCYSRKEYVTHHYALDREYFSDGRWVHVERRIENVMSKLCRSDYDINKEGRCKGCNVEQDHTYFEEKGL